MDLLQQIREHIRAYVAGRLSINDLQLALADYHQPALDAARVGDERAEHLVNKALALVSEYSLGHREADELRDELAEDVESRRTTTTHVYIGSTDSTSAATGAQSARSYVSAFHVPATWPVVARVPSTQGAAKLLHADPVYR